MTTRFVLLLVGVCLFRPICGSPNRAIRIHTFKCDYDFVYHEPGAPATPAPISTSPALEARRAVIGPVGEVGFNHFDGGTIVSLMAVCVCARIRIILCCRTANLLSGCITAAVCDVNASRFKVGPVWFSDGEPTRQNSGPVRHPTCLRRGERRQCGAALGRRGIAANK